MANEKPQVGKIELAKVEAPKAVIDLRGHSLNDQQFAKLQKTLVYAAAVFGILSSGKQPTPTKRNLEEVKAYADAVLEMVG